MHRSSSTCGISEEYAFVCSSAQGFRSSSGTDREKLPTFDPLSHLAKKERSRLRFAENAVHVIPIILVFCAVVLWFFSNPEKDKTKNLKNLSLGRTSSRPCDGAFSRVRTSN